LIKRDESIACGFCRGAPMRMAALPNGVISTARNKEFSRDGNTFHRA
jgi:hypothetical protein